MINVVQTYLLLFQFRDFQSQKVVKRKRRMDIFGVAASVLLLLLIIGVTFILVFYVGPNFQSTANAVVQAVETGINNIVSIGTTVINDAGSLINTFGTEVVALANEIATAVSSAVSQLVTAIETLGTQIAAAFVYAYNSIKSLVNSIVNSVTNFYNSQISPVIALISPIVSSTENILDCILSAVRAFLGVIKICSSPSDCLSLIPPINSNCGCFGQFCSGCYFPPPTPNPCSDPGCNAC
jgi:predicted PurR-regulated permease PerM